MRAYMGDVREHPFHCLYLCWMLACLRSENESVHSLFIPMHRHKALESSFADLKFEI